jgi:hypothetical protein
MIEAKRNQHEKKAKLKKTRKFIILPRHSFELEAFQQEKEEYNQSINC